MKQRLVNKVEGMINRKLKELEYTVPKYQHKVEKDIADLSDIYFSLDEIHPRDLMAIKMIDEKISFILNKDLNLPKALKKYATQLVENLKMLNESPELI